MRETAPFERIGHYRILRKLGQGGMGVVYAAQDERLDRLVALKVINDGPHDELAQKRFWREARAAARVNHPNICQLYEIGEHRETLFIAMELLEGESLADRITRGPVPFSEAIRISLGMLAALEALHAQGFIHRDLKPSNVFLATHAVKLLDFGLAKAIDQTPADETTGQLTQRGVIVGTPRYMSPEQLRGFAVDPRTDVFAAGAVLFEMLSGQPAFGGTTALDVMHAVAFEQPPALRGEQAVERASLIIRRALAKEPSDRYSTISSMAQELRALSSEVPSTAVHAQHMSWLIVLPFRVLRSDSEAEFLAFGLADAITSSLAGLQSLGVRSSAVAARFAGDAPDLAQIAREAHVDLVLTGAFMRAGQQIRVNTQLVEAPSGSLVWSHTAQVTMRDVFQLQDDIVQRIVGSLSLPLTAREHRLLRHDVPASPSAYEFYLRGGQISQQIGLASVDQSKIARDLYLRSVEEDPRYAPVWARLGRCYRVIGKAGEDVDANLAKAESCLKRALELNPDLGVAHNLYAQLETDLGRSKDAMVRLITRAAGSSDPDVFAGLVLACRNCGKLEASVAAHERARLLDPQIATSVRHTYWLLGDNERALQSSHRFYFEGMVLASMGQTEGAIALLTECEKVNRPEVMQSFLASLRALLQGKRQESLDATERCIAHFRDPEALFYMARQLARLGESGRAFTVLHNVLDQGYVCAPALMHDRWLEALRSQAEFGDLLQRAVTLEREAADAFVRAGGDRLLGPQPPLASSAERP